MGKNKLAILNSFFLSVLILLAITYKPSSIFAQQVSLAISPPLLEVLIKPGKSILIAYKVENYGDPVIVASHVQPFEPSDNTGNIRIKDQFEGPIRFSLENADLTLGQSSLVKTLESQQYLLRIRVPEGAPEGDYYYTFLAQTEPPPPVAGISSPRARATIGSNILITVSETGQLDVNPKIAVFDLLTRYKVPFFGKRINIFDSSDPVPVVMIVENRGRNFIKPQGQILLRGNFGERATFDIVPQNILSGSQRYVLASPSADIDCGGERPSSLCKTSLSLLLKGFFVGNYKLSTAVNFGEGTPNLQASTEFIAIPFKFIAALIAVCIAGYVIIRKVKNW